MRKYQVRFLQNRIDAMAKLNTQNLAHNMLVYKKAAYL